MVSFAVEGLTRRKIIVQAFRGNGGGNGLNETIDSERNKTLVAALDPRPKNDEIIFTLSLRMQSPFARSSGSE